MRWRRKREASDRIDGVAPVVMAVTSPLNQQTARELAAEVERVTDDAPVVIDLTGIPSFDSEGTAALLRLQESSRSGRLSIVGLRQATARLLGDVEADDEAPISAPGPGDAGWAVRRLRNLVVVQAASDVASTDALEPPLVEAMQSTAAIVVVDLRGVEELTGRGLEAITFASSTAALRGQELLVVNVDADAADALRTAGLSATTYVAPEPPLEPGLPAW